MLAMVPSRGYWGFPSAFFRIDNLVDFAIRSLPGDIRKLEFSLTDISNPENSELLYVATAMHKSAWEIRRSFDVAGRKWQLLTSATASYINERRTKMPFVMLIGGMLIQVC